MKFIFSGKAWHADDYAKRNGLAPQDFKWISHEEKLRGYRIIDVIILGGFKQHPRWLQIDELIYALETMDRATTEYIENW